MRGGSLLLAVLLAVVVGVTGGCGIPTDGAPRPLAEETPSSPSDPAPETGDTTATVYLVSGDQLLATERALDGSKSPETVLELLLLPTSEEEQAARLQTLIPQSTTSLGVTDEGDGVWAIDMSPEWATLAAPADLYAYGQIVLTLTTLSGVESVRFLVDGVGVDAPPTVNGVASALVTADDYAALEPQDDDETTTSTTDDPN